ncbi:hypothetical protein ACLOJK_023689, partial [Asimina triloba]
IIEAVLREMQAARQSSQVADGDEGEMEVPVVEEEKENRRNLKGATVAEEERKLTAAVEIDDKEEDQKGRTITGRQREREGTTANEMIEGEGRDDADEDDDAVEDTMTGDSIGSARKGRGEERQGMKTVEGERREREMVERSEADEDGEWRTTMWREKQMRMVNDDEEGEADEKNDVAGWRANKNERDKEKILVERRKSILSMGPDPVGPASREQP